jgi:ATP-dependent RNA helicase RhlE
VRNPVRVAIGSTTKPAEQVDLDVYEVEQDRKLGLLTRLLDQEQGSFLVFARTKHGTDRLAKKLARAGVKAARIHGDRTQNQRNQALAGFKEGEYRVLVATDVAARGIHVDGIAHVVNYDLPQAPEDFVHRIGRTGRAGARGTASTFSTRAERSEIRNIERSLKVRLKVREVAADIPREVKQQQHQGKVVVMPTFARSRARANGMPRRRKFAGR